MVKESKCFSADNDILVPSSSLHSSTGSTSSSRTSFTTHAQGVNTEIKGKTYPKGSQYCHTTPSNGLNYTSRVVHSPWGIFEGIVGKFKRK